MRNAVILIPCYEPDDKLISTVKGIAAHNFEILVVNDGSSKEFDPTFDRIKPYVKYLAYETNKGKGYALKYGFKYIPTLFPDAKYVITVDSDGQHLIKDIIKVYDSLNRTDELVFGVRTFEGDIPRRSIVGNVMSKLSRSLVTKQYMQDDQCGLRGFPVRYIEELLKIRGNRYEYEMNQVVIFEQKHYRIHQEEIETIYLEENSSSHFSPFKDTFKIQSIIYLHSIVELICNVLLIFFIIFAHQRGMHILTSTAICYMGSMLLCVILSSIVYPSKNIIRRLFVEMSFAVVKMALALLLEYLFIMLLGLPYLVFVPIFVIILIFINIPLSYLLYKIGN